MSGHPQIHPVGTPLRGVRPTSALLTSLALAALALSPAIRAAEPAPKPPAATPAAPAPAKPLTDEQKTALKILDIEIDRLSALLTSVEDAAMRGAAKSTLDGFKDRRHALRSEFDTMAYDELRLAVLVEYQRLLLWLAPPLQPAPPPAKSKSHG